MTTIYSISPEGKERYDTVESSQVAKKIKMLKNAGWLNIKVIA
jgi:hypothetical protein